MTVLFIADDHKIFADGLRMIIDYTTEYQLAGVVHHGHDVIPFLAEHPVDILLLDIDLPGKSGIDIAREVSVQFPAVKILALSMLNDYESVKTMLGAGALGYCLKTAGTEEFLSALSNLCNNESYISPSLMPILINGQKLTPQKRGHNDQINSLTARESIILQAFAQGKNAGQIADELFLSKHTVESHRKSIYAKLNVHSFSELMAFAIKHKLASNS